MNVFVNVNNSVIQTLVLNSCKNNCPQSTMFRPPQISLISQYCWCNIGGVWLTQTATSHPCHAHKANTHNVHKSEIRLWTVQQSTSTHLPSSNSYCSISHSLRNITFPGNHHQMLNSHFVRNVRFISPISNEELAGRRSVVVSTLDRQSRGCGFNSPLGWLTFHYALRFFTLIFPGTGCVKL